MAGANWRTCTRVSSVMFADARLRTTRDRNVGRINPVLQAVREGDFVRSASTNWPGGKYKYLTGRTVVSLVIERPLVLSDKIEHGSRSLVLRPTDVGTTRFFSEGSRR